MTFATVLWFGFSFLINVILALFFAVISGLGLAAGFDLFKKFKNRKKDKANQDFIAEYTQQAASGGIID
jgi:predicted RND superfamily exporter protein